ncbi:MAG: transglutaminase family protein [Acidobacteriota bacterium]|nr:transglutaminase family protein [Acidobacteriota bacterium]
MEFVKTGTPEPTSAYLKPTEFFDSEVASVREFASEAIESAETDVEKAVALYYAVRDTIRYDPYRDKLDRASYQASNLLAAKAGFCLPKANLLIALARAVNIHAAIGLSDVVNHLCTDRLQRIMGGKNLFLHHGYAVLFLEGQWVKAAPAFNIELCDRFHVLPTEFDGKSDALFQPFDSKGRRHMEYVCDHGIWSDFPYQRVLEDFLDYYPDSFNDPGKTVKNDSRFEEEQPLS